MREPAEIRQEAERQGRNRHRAPTTASLADALFDAIHQPGCYREDLEDLAIQLSADAAEGIEYDAGQVDVIKEHIARLLAKRKS